jgi:hypothetical protein
MDRGDTTVMHPSWRKIAIALIDRGCRGFEWACQEWLCRRRFFGRTHRVEEAEELFDMRHLERVVDALTHTYQRQTPSAMLARDVRSHERSDACWLKVTSGSL